MTFRTYLDDNNLGTAFESGPDTVRTRIARDWEREAHLNFRAAGERHAEAEGITDEIVEAAVTKATTWRSVGCDNLGLVSSDGMCRRCFDEQTALNYESLNNPYRQIYWHAIAFAVTCVVVTLAVIVGVVKSGFGQ